MAVKGQGWGQLLARDRVRTKAGRVREKGQDQEQGKIKTKVGLDSTEPGQDQCTARGHVLAMDRAGPTTRQGQKGTKAKQGQRRARETAGPRLVQG